METGKVYLKPNTVIEPLVDSWYAWPHLISPATAARNITGRHLKIIDSYIQAPQVHAAASKNPKMRGGPFMDYAGFNRSEEIRQLKQKTESDCADLIELSDAIDELNELLESHPQAHSLEPLYDKVPECLKGYVELIYDLNNNPSYRFFEPLLYLSKYNKKDGQSIAMWVTNNDERPFVLSTPRLAADNVLNLQIPFDHPVIDIMAKMKREPRLLSDVLEHLDLSGEEIALFETFFTTDVPLAYNNYTGDKVRMRYFGHACILIETSEISILVDPLISYYGYHSSTEHFSDADLPDVIDYVLITHNHQDHILFETLLPLRHKIKNIIVPRTNSGSLQDPNLKLMFNNIGFHNITEIDEFESITFKDCTITGIPFIGEHSDLDIKSKICHHVKIGELTMLFVADSCNVEAKIYEHVHQLTGDVDVVFLGMECDGAPLSWLYGPLMSKPLPRDIDNGRRLAGSNYERGKALVDRFDPAEVYVYAMGQEPWVEFISSIKYTEDSHPIVASNRLIAECSAYGRVAERLYGEKEILYTKDKIKKKEAVNLLHR